MLNQVAHIHQSGIGDWPGTGARYKGPQRALLLRSQSAELRSFSAKLPAAAADESSHLQHGVVDAARDPLALGRRGLDSGRAIDRRLGLKPELDHVATHTAGDEHKHDVVKGALRQGLSFGQVGYRECGATS